MNNATSYKHGTQKAIAMFDDGKQQTLRLIGASVSRMPGSVMDQLLAMRADICRYNHPRGLSMALLYCGGWFLQWLEGPAEAVEQAWIHTQSHPAHTSLRVIHRSMGPSSLTEPLHIVTLHSRDKATDVARRLYQVERERALGWSAEPAEIWQRMSAPCQVQSDDVMATVARRVVIAVTSEYTESVDLIKAIAERRHSVVNYQRLADSNISNGDVGAAYVDVACANHVARVQALSRRALTNSMVKLSLHQMHCAVLLLGNRPQPAANLAASVANLVASIPTRPAVRVIGPSHQICSSAAECFAGMPDLDIAEIHTAMAGLAQVDAVLNLIADGGFEAALPPAVASADSGHCADGSAAGHASLALDTVRSFDGATPRVDLYL